jgi:hypothetical protein
MPPNRPLAAYFSKIRHELLESGETTTKYHNLSKTFSKNFKLVSSMQTTG